VERPEQAVLVLRHVFLLTLSADAASASPVDAVSSFSRR
jgi:hypothetical protein